MESRRSIVASQICSTVASDCQSLNGRWLEPMIEKLVLQALEPASLQLSLEAAGDIEKDRARLETHHKQSLERATYQADLARRRYEEVDPSNRLVAAELEKRWETALVTQRKSEEALNRFRQETPTTADARRDLEDHGAGKRLSVPLDERVRRPAKTVKTSCAF